jgi:dTDP-4-amino-4,6-dideoxygalactose transaminase
MIKFLDIIKNDRSLHEKMFKELRKTFKKGDFILGNKVREFEKKFAIYTNAKYAIGCANGTDALLLALKSLNLPRNSEVILPAMTYCSTIFAVINANLKPVLADIDENSSTININQIQKKISRRTKVILPVHLYGSAINMNLIRNLTNKFKHKIYIIDDCAQAHGSYDDLKRKIGSTSDISCFSFYPGKNLGAYGDAGIITTNNKIFFGNLQKLRNLGSNKKFVHTLVGFNSRLDTIQAIVLNEKLPKLDYSNNLRIRIARIYDDKIKNKKFKKLLYSKYAVYHQYVIKCKERFKLIKYLDKNKIEYGFHYPNAIHQLDIFKKKFKGKSYPNSEILAKQGISLPIDPLLNKKQIHYIITKLNSF